MPIETAHANAAASSAASDISGTRVQILADDLTGACDAAVAFLAAGHTVRVWFGTKALYPAAESVQAFYTASRHLAADQAAEAVARAVRELGVARSAGTLLFKKVDSAGRGPMAAELLAAHRASGTRAILFAPAFPAMGRTVRNGVLQIRDASGTARELSLASLFPVEMHGQIALIAHPGELAAALNSGKFIFICDSETENDLRDLAESAAPLPALLYAGSAGLAHALAALNPAPASDGIKTPLDAHAPHAARILVITGSPHAVTLMQLAELESAGFPGNRVQIMGEQERWGCDKIDLSGFSSGELAAILAASKGGILARFEAFDPEVLILTGGATAQVVVETLRCDSILLRGQFSAGIPWGVLQGGSAHGRIAVTKSGGFGTASTLRDLVAHWMGAE